MWRKKKEEYKKEYKEYIKKKKETSYLKELKKKNYGLRLWDITFVTVWTIISIITMYYIYEILSAPLDYNNIPESTKEWMKLETLQTWSTALGILLYSRILSIIIGIFSILKEFFYNSFTVENYFIRVIDNIKFQIVKLLTGIKFGYVMLNNYWWFFLILSLLISWAGIFATKNQVDTNSWITLFYHIISGSLPCFSLISTSLGCYFLKNGILYEWAIDNLNGYKLSKFEIFFLGIHFFCGLVMGYWIFSKILSLAYFIIWNYSHIFIFF